MEMGIEVSIIVPRYLEHKDIFNWFINQDHVPFMWESTSYQTLYDEFIKELNKIYNRDGSNFFWFIGGKLYGDEMFRNAYTNSDPIVVPANHIEVNISKMRESKIDYILNEKSNY